MFEKRPLLEELFLHYFRIPEEEEVCEPLSINCPNNLSFVSVRSILLCLLIVINISGADNGSQKKMKKDRKYYYVIPETEEPGADVPVG